MNLPLPLFDRILNDLKLSGEFRETIEKIEELFAQFSSVSIV